jgi:hypothetical protein
VISILNYLEQSDSPRSASGEFLGKRIPFFGSLPFVYTFACKILKEVNYSHFFSRSPLPCRQPMHVVVGKPIEVTKTLKPTDEEVSLLLVFIASA